MRFRKLRIAWSVFWGLAALLLIVLCVRSYWWCDILAIYPSSRSFGLGSVQGELVYTSTTFPFTFGPQPQWTAHSQYITATMGFPLMRDGQPVNTTMGFGWFSDVHWLYVFVPHGLPIFATVAAALTPWIIRTHRFSLRTLLIATTLIAVILGLIVYLR
jgi:hypothetical protein